MDRLIARAIARAGSAIDRGALRLMTRAFTRRGPRRPPADARRRLVELAAHYRDAHDQMFAPPPPVEVAVRDRGQRHGGRVLDLSFESHYRPAFAPYASEHHSYLANLTARVRLFTGDRPAPTAILLHGWAGGNFWFDERTFPVAYLRRIGLDVALFQLPFHGERAPRQSPVSGSLFLGSHLVRTNEGFAQAIFDLRALRRYLIDGRGAPAVGVIGMSLGGYTTALWARLDADLAFAIPMIPAVSMADLMWRHGEQSPQRARAQKVGIDADLLGEVFTVHSPLTAPAQVPFERRMIIAGRGDAITPPDHAERLWEHWERPPIHWFAGSHVAQIGRGEAFRAIRHHLAGLGLARRPARTR